jgi:hypothetical protein
MDMDALQELKQLQLDGTDQEQMALAIRLIRLVLADIDQRLEHLESGT